jgi:hypothetical protein
MGIGLYLTGEVGSPGDPLEHIEGFLRRRDGNDLILLYRGHTEEGLPALFLQHHPAAEAVEFWLEERKLTVSARTSTAGPGYHADLCDILHTVGEQLQITWDPPDEEGSGDQTGYFHTRDLAALEQQMLVWFEQVLVLLHEKGQEFTGLQFSMPTAPRYHGPEGAFLLTQMGPRSQAWVEAAMADPRAGLDVFPWWSPGKGAATELGRVKVQLWMDVRWHPAETDEEEGLGRELLERLARAYELDPTLDYPWKAWERLHDEVVGAEEELPEIVRTKARQAPDEPLGYREFEVTEVLNDRWTITIPGSFSMEMEDGTWSAWEDGASIWATAFSLPEGTDQIELPVGDSVPEDSTTVSIEELEEDEVNYCAFSHTFLDEGERYWQIQAQILSESRLLLLTVVVPAEDQLDWAHQVIATVQGY